LEDHNKALSHYNKALRIRKTKLSQNHLDIAQIECRIALVYSNMGEHNKSMALNNEVLEIRTDSLGNDHELVAAHKNIGNTHQELGNYKLALESHHQLTILLIERLGKDHQDVADSYWTCGLISKMMLNYSEALEHYTKALNIWENIYSGHQYDIAYAWWYMGEALRNMGSYNLSLEYHETSLKMLIELLGNDHIDVAGAYWNCGIVYEHLYNYEDAIKYLRNALQIYEPIHKENYVSVATQMADMYTQLGNYNKATQIFNRISQMKEVLIENPYLEEQRLFMLSRLQHDIGNFNEARKLSEESLDIAIEEFGEMHFRVASIYTLMAVIFRELDLEKSREASFKALEISSKIYPDNHPDLAHSYFNLSMVNRQLEQYEEAIENNNKAIEVWRKQLDEDHPNIISCYVNLAIIYEKKKQHKQAQSIWHDVISKNLKRLNETYHFLPISQRIEYANTLRNSFNGFYSYVSKYGNNDMNKLAAYLSLNSNSLALDYSISIREMIYQTKNDTLNTLKKELDEVNREISQIELFTDEERQEKKYDISHMTGKQEQLTQEIEDALKGHLKIESISWQTLQESLAPGDVTIDFISFYEEHENTVSYYAILTKSDIDAPHFIRIGSDNELQPFFETTEYESKPLYINNSTELNTLREIIWQPLTPYLQGVENIHMSSSGLLHRIDFDLLQDSNTNKFSSNYKFHYYNSIRDFVKKASQARGAKRSNHKPKHVVLVGDIEYDYAEQDESEETLNTSLRDGLDPLPATKEEISIISEIVTNNNGTNRLITGRQANEQVLQNITQESSPHIFHFATHGKYLSPVDSIGQQAMMQNRMQSSANPMQRSMLMLSGANHAWTSKEHITRSDQDGILTALEISTMDFNHVDLVVLSACNTGLGDVYNTEGIIGLQSAFKLAGAKNVIVSLWKVNDVATKDLMILFYENLLTKNQDVATALRNAKRTMKEKGAKPEHTAGFILIE